MLFLPLLFESGQGGPQQGGQPNNKQIQGAEDQRLKGVTVFMDQQAAAGHLCGKKEEQTQRQADAAAPFGNCRPTEAPVISFPVDGKHKQTQEGLGQSPCALQQSVQPDFHPEHLLIVVDSVYHGLFCGTRELCHADLRSLGLRMAARMLSTCILSKKVV